MTLSLSKAELTNPSLNNSNDRMAFFYNPPDDHQIYHITCELSRENIDSLSDHTFYYNINDNNLIFKQKNVWYRT